MAMSMSAKAKLSAPPRCPLCGKREDPANKPFCSQGCRDRDLLNWLDEGYRIPVREEEEAGETGLDIRPDPSL